MRSVRSSQCAPPELSISTLSVSWSRVILRTPQPLMSETSAAVPSQLGSALGRAASTRGVGGSDTLGAPMRATEVCKVTPSITVLPRSRPAVRSMAGLSLCTRPTFTGVRCFCTLPWGSWR